MWKVDFCRIVLMFLFALGATGSINAASCRFDGVELLCGDGRNSSVLEAMASAETSDLLAHPLRDLNKFERPADLEKFRKSVEANWRIVNKAEVKQRTRMLRNKISATEFAEWSKTYNFARNNYSAALTYYRTLIWHGKTGKAPRKD